MMLTVTGWSKEHMASTAKEGKQFWADNNPSLQTELYFPGNL